MRRQLVILTMTGIFAAAEPSFAGWDEGVAAFRAKNYAQAAREFEAVIAERADWSGGYLMLGRTQLFQNRASDAVSTLRKGYDLNPSDIQVQLYLSQAYLTAGRAGEAAQLLSKINAAGLPKEQQGFYQQLYAKALADSGQSDRAASALAKAAAASPNDADLQYQYGALALNAGDTAAAVAALERATRLAPNDSAKLKTYVQALIRQAREAGGSANDSIYAKAAEAGRNLAARDGSYDNLLLLGEVQLGAKQYEAAVATFGQASAKNASDWLPGFYAGQAQTAVQKYTEAEASLKRALEKAGRSEDKARIYRQLGFVYEKQKNLAAAKGAYQSAGDGSAVARIQQNEDIAKHNTQADEESKRLAEIKAQQELIKKQLQQQSAPPPPGN